MLHVRLKARIRGRNWTELN